MMPPTFETLAETRLVAAVGQLKQEGWRLVQVSATRLVDGVEVTYSFDRALELRNLRLLVAVGAPLPSISSVYWNAFLYENEIHDLFAVPVTGMAVDFHGAFYKTAIPFPFAAAPKSRTGAAAASPAAKPPPPGGPGAVPSNPPAS